LNGEKLIPKDIIPRNKLFRRQPIKIGEEVEFSAKFNPHDVYSRSSIKEYEILIKRNKI